MVAREASVKDMEAAAVAWAAHLHACPMFALKAVTDIVDGALILLTGSGGPSGSI